MRKFVQSVKTNRMKRFCVVGSTIIGTGTIIGYTTVPKWGPFVASVMYTENIFDLRTHVRTDTLNNVTKFSANLGFYPEDSLLSSSHRGIFSWSLKMVSNIYEGNTLLLQYLLNSKKIDPKTIMHVVNEYTFIGRCEPATLEFMTRNDMIRHCDSGFVFTNIKTALPDLVLEVVDDLTSSNAAAIKQLLLREFFFCRSSERLECLIKKAKVTEEEMKDQQILAPHFTELFHITDIRQKLIALDKIGVKATNVPDWICAVYCCIEAIDMQIQMQTQGQRQIGSNSSMIKEFSDLLKYLQSGYADDKLPPLLTKKQYREIVNRCLRDTNTRLCDMLPEQKIEIK